METVKIINEGCLGVATNSWSKEKIISFFDFEENKLLGGFDMLFLPEILKKIKETSKYYNRYFWTYEQTSQLGISEKIKMAPKTTLDWDEMLTTVFTMLEFHNQQPDFKLLTDNGPNYFLSAGDQRIFSLNFFQLVLQRDKNNKWEIGCDYCRDTKINDTFWYPLGSKLFFAIEPVP